MTLPTNKAEYEERFALNNKLSGFGVDTTMHMPCPFCAAPDFMVYRIIETHAALREGGTCVECHRGFRGDVTVTSHGTSCEFVQTCGDDAPDYIPAMRRVKG